MRSAVLAVFTLFRAFLLIAGIAGSISPAWTAGGPGVSRVTLQPRKLQKEIADRLLRVEEFQALRAEAKRLGVRVWLFGGTAASFGHYVRWDLQREGGDSRFQKDRFDYDYTNIYRSTQDLDIVIDGSANQAEALEAFLANKFPYFQGVKSAWEVRLLRGDRGDKEAILGNPDFQDQHTDSNSTGMIEVTEPSSGEPVVRDVRDWNSKEPEFLRDLAEATLHYYHSPRHQLTRRFLRGMNPAIFSVVRYLTKALQYDLKPRAEDLKRIEQEIRSFDSKADLSGSYAQRWLEMHAKKLFQHAVDVERSAAWLDELGLRKKLIELAGTDGVNHVDSLAWWLKKAPLPSLPVGQGSGETAQELGIFKVAHATSDFLAYESITRSHLGVPNVFVSRESAAGERAIYGEGFYTAVGNRGGMTTGMTIRFEVDPRARLNHDFKIVRMSSGNSGMTLNPGDYVIFLNRNALKVIPESLQMSLPGYLLMLAGNARVSADDQALLEKLKRRMRAKFMRMTADDAKEIETVFSQVKIDEIGVLRLGEAWFELDPKGERRMYFERIVASAPPEAILGAYLSIERQGKFAAPERKDFVAPLLKKRISKLNHDEIEKADLWLVRTLEDWGKKGTRLVLADEMNRFWEWLDLSGRGKGAAAFRKVWPRLSDSFSPLSRIALHLKLESFASKQKSPVLQALLSSSRETAQKLTKAEIRQVREEIIGQLMSADVRDEGIFGTLPVNWTKFLPDLGSLPTIGEEILLSSFQELAKKSPPAILAIQSLLLVNRPDANSERELLTGYNVALHALAESTRSWSQSTSRKLAGSMLDQLRTLGRGSVNTPLETARTMKHKMEAWLALPVAARHPDVLESALAEENLAVVKGQVYAALFRKGADPIDLPEAKRKLQETLALEIDILMGFSNPSRARELHPEESASQSFKRLTGLISPGNAGHLLLPEVIPQPAITLAAIFESARRLGKGLEAVRFVEALGKLEEWRRSPVLLEGISLALERMNWVPGERLTGEFLNLFMKGVAGQVVRSENLIAVPGADRLVEQWVRFCGSSPPRSLGYNEIPAWYQEVIKIAVPGKHPRKKIWLSALAIKDPKERETYLIDHQTAKKRPEVACVVKRLSNR